MTWPATVGGGAQGPPGPQGPPGNARAPVLSTSIVTRRFVFQDGRPVTVSCPTNRQAVGGGADAPGESFPVVKIEKGKGLRAVAVVWTFQLRKPPPQIGVSQQSVSGRTFNTGFPVAGRHYHNFQIAPKTYVTQFREPPRDWEVNVYVICARVV